MTRDGRIEQNEIQAALTKRLALLRIGGYPEHQRRLPPPVHAAVFARDGGSCRLSGVPASEIDHISGSSSDLTNLQAVCATCHFKKSLGIPQHAALPTADLQARLARALERQPEFARRVGADMSLRLCDDEVRWDRIQRDLLKAARADPEMASTGDEDGPALGEGMPQSAEEREHAWYL